jgi:tetratricopeptide (TPR) repeat protein
MDLMAGFRRLVAGFGVILLAGVATARGAEPAAPPTNAPAQPSEESVEAQRALRSYLHLQEQLHATLLAIEQTRMENALAARTNSEALATRLKLIEESLIQSREQQMESMRHSSRTMLTLAGIFVSVGFLTLLFMAFFQLRGMHRLAEIATGLPGGHFPAGLEPGEARLIGSGGGLQTARLHGLIERLEGRILELETSAHAAHPAQSPNGPVERNPFVNLRDVTPDAPSHTTVLLGKGQTLLNLGQPESALSCFDEVLALDPDNAEVHLRKGMALERLKRFDEAVACCERAIALDRSLTQAYLCKGSLFNHQERYKEALECYEQALRTEAKASL